MMRRHSWTKKIKGTVRCAKNISYGGHTRKIYKLDDVKECQHCGLMKGVQKGGVYIKWHNTIYFKDGEFLSEEKLPYACIGKQANFLTEEDFYV